MPNTQKQIAEQAAVRGRDPKTRKIIATLSTFAVASALLTGWALYHAYDKERDAANAGQGLAAQVEAACNDDIPDRPAVQELCERAADVVDDASGPVVGPQGPKGDDGRDGVDGVDGVDGLPGRPGKDGRDGENGIDGSDGRDGRGGSNGSDGLPGAAGPTGAPGESITGPQGPAGPAGPPGPQGPQGERGADGQDGADGVPGTALPGTYSCSSGQWLVGFTVAADGAVTLDCRGLPLGP